MLSGSITINYVSFKAMVSVFLSLVSFLLVLFFFRRHTPQITMKSIATVSKIIGIDSVLREMVSQLTPEKPLHNYIRSLPIFDLKLTFHSDMI